MENKAHALAAGAFVVLLSSLLLALALWLTRESGDTQIYEVSTSGAVTGLQAQAVVRFRGVKVGKVMDIGFDAQTPGNVLVRIAVDDDTPVTRNTFATLGFQGVTGIAFVQLDDAGGSAQRLPTREDQPARIPMRAGLVDQLSEQSGRILAQLEDTSRRLNQLLALENQQVLIQSVAALGQAAASVPPVMQEAGRTLQTVRSAVGSVADSSSALRQTAVDVSRLVQRVQQPGGALEQLSLGAGALAGGGQALQTDTLPLLGRVLDDTSRAARQVGRVAGALQEQPQSLLLGPGRGLPGPGEPGFVTPRMEGELRP